TMVSQLVKHERIETTVAKAKEVRRLADNMVQLGKEGTLCAARQAAAFVRGDDVLHKLFTELAYRYKDRAGGYTRLLRTRIRVGDAAPMAYIDPSHQSPSRHRGHPWIPGQDLDSPDNSHHLKKRRDLSLTIELSSQTMQLELHLRVLFASWCDFDVLVASSVGSEAEPPPYRRQ
ncbi:UNVERIFIED_CONTAM: 50S ribosomal protein L17, partial [Sesamum calycinum]